MSEENSNLDAIKRHLDAAKRSDAAPHPAEHRARILQREAEESATANENTIRPPTNERVAASNYAQSLGRASGIRFGKIQWAAPYAQWYRVALDNGNGDMPCCRLQETAAMPFSVKATSPLSVGASVLVWLDAATPYGVILGTVPDITTDGTAQWHDWVSQGSNGGFRRERYYREFPQLFVRDGGQIDFSNWSPPDSSGIGEWSRMDPLGGGLHIDALMKFLRVDESCGLWLFYMDRLARLACNNLEVISAVHEQNVRGDEGEAHHYQGFSPFLWEAHGAWKSGLDTHRETSDEDVHYRKPYGKYEPKTDDQQAIYRWEEYRDYLGQGYRRSMFLPPVQADGMNRWSDQLVRPGVFVEHVGLEGHYALQTAHSFSITKQLLLPIPKKLSPPEDPQGDDAKNSDYRFAGTYGNGPEHKVAGQPASQDDLPNLQAAAQLQDLLAYARNWKSLHVFDYHTKDYHTPQQSNIPPFSTAQYLPPYADLASQQWLGLPPKHTAHVDHRYGGVDYYTTTAGLHVLPDGSLVLRDGYGSELRMSGGSVQLSAAGDVWMQPGRNFNVWGGDDVILKAHNSVDITTTNHDVRIKAERHCDVLAGNNGALGRLLLQCQTAGSLHDTVGKEGEDVAQSGVILKCAKGDIVSLAQNIKLRTGGGDLLPGMIILDADKGKQVVRMVADQVVCHVKNGFNVAMPVAGKTHVHHFGPSVIHAVTGVCMEGGLIVRKNGIQLRGPFVGIDCIIVSDLNKSGLIAVHKPGDRSWNVVAANIAKCKRDFGKMNEAMTDDYVQGVEKYWYAAGRAGNDEVITGTAFAPRTAAQMGTQNFTLPETYYQTLANAGAGMGGWTEKVIMYQGREYMPYPSKEAWTDPTAFRRAQFNMHDIKTGRDKDRREPYLDPKLATWVRQALNGNYPVARY